MPSGALAAGETLVVPLDGRAELSTKGGQITLLDATGLKVHGVAYTAKEGARQGWAVTF